MSEARQNTVSVAMCTYNGTRYLAPQLQSIAEQTRLPDEVIFCDDGSTDATLEVLRDWANQVPFSVKIFQNQRNLGYTKNFERAISLCSGDWIFLSDHDDVWMPTRIERTAAVFDRDTQVGLVTTDAEIIDESGTAQGMRLREFVRRMHILEFWKFFYPPVGRMTLWTGCTMAVRRSAVEALLPIPGNLSCHDIWLYLLMPFFAREVFLDECLVQYRLHGQNHSTAPTVESLRRDPPKWRYFSTFLDTLATHPELIATLSGFVETLPESPLRTRYLRQLARHRRHFEARQNLVAHPSLWWREIFNGGYFCHPQAIRAILYDLLRQIRSK